MLFEEVFRNLLRRRDKLRRTSVCLSKVPNLVRYRRRAVRVELNRVRALGTKHTNELRAQVTLARLVYIRLDLGQCRFLAVRLARDIMENNAANCNCRQLIAVDHRRTQSFEVYGAHHSTSWP